MSAGTVGELAERHLGNLLFALELAALTLEEQGRRDDALFYRRLAREMAEARGRETGQPPAT